jgi:tetratricopeptide (TPR) repeat protein
MPLKLFFAGTAETDDAIAVYVPRENILMSGDTVMTGSFPIFGQPCWDEGLEGNERWINTIKKIMSFDPAHIVPGHGPIAHQAEIDLLIRIERYFIDEVKALVQKGYFLEQVLKDLEPRLPGWITDPPLVWGTPRYAILRVFRGLTKKPSDREFGWQQFKPSAVPQSDEDSVNRKIQGKSSADDFLQIAHEAGEGGDTALKLSVLKKAAQKFASSPDVLSVYAEALIEASRAEASVLEKGDFFQAARQCWDTALVINPSHIGSLLGKGRYMTMMAYRGGDDPKPGMDLLRKVIEFNIQGRERAEAEFYVGIGHRRLGDETKARAQFQKAVQYDPAFMPAHIANQ